MQFLTSAVSVMTIKNLMRFGLAIIITFIFVTAAAFAQQNEKHPRSSADEDDHPGLESLAALVAEQTKLIEWLRRQVDEQHRRFDEQARVLDLLKQELELMRQQVNRGPRSSAADTELAAATQRETQAAAAQNPPPTQQAQSPQQQSRPTQSQGTRIPNDVSGTGTGAGVVRWVNGRPLIRSSDGRFEMGFSGYAHFDYRGYQSGANAPANTFVLRRARLGVGGKMYENFEYKLLADFSDTNSTVMRDAWLNIKYRPQFQMRFGQFKEPFSQEEVRGDENQDFVERSMVNNLSPSRSPGMQIWGEFLNGRFTYQAGAFNGKGLLMNNSSSTPEGVVRLRLTPWQESTDERIKGLSFGGAWAVGRQRGGLSFTGRTESRSAEFFMAEPVNGPVTRANAELTYLYKGFALRAEYDQTNQDRDGLGLRKTNLPGVVAKGFMTHATYVLTGEPKPDDGPVEPKQKVLAGEGQQGGTGAWELKFRYSNLQLADGFISNRADTFTTGVNWYLNRYIKYVLDLNIERFKNPQLSPNPGERNFFTVLTRLQLTF